jgi:hypothetical protein
VRRALLLGVALFALLEAVAMTLYPGGTWWDPAARGHRFWQNYLCDLSWRVSLNGGDNHVGALFAQAAMLVLIAAFVPFWWLDGSGGTPTGRALRGLGLSSVAGMTAVALMPSERFGALHGVAVMGAGVTGLGAALLATVSQLRSGERVTGTMGVVVLAAAGVDLVVYGRTMGTGGPGPLMLPALQKVALVTLLVWMTRVALRPDPRGTPRDEP